ncbi:MAG: hypothetical protein GY810_25050 [Aureispira sp.]|nr:hypothetical protein [Aureispira sp.]
MKEGKGFRLNSVKSIFGVGNYYLLGLLLFLFSCNSTATNGNTEGNEEEEVRGNSSSIELGDLSAIEDYFLKLPEGLLELNVETRKKLLQAKTGGNVKIDGGEAKMIKLDVSNEYLSFSYYYDTGEGGGYGLSGELAIFKNGGNSMLIFSSTDGGSGYESATSTVTFFKVEGDQLNKTKVDFPAFKVKDFFAINGEAECNGEAGFTNFSSNLSKNSENIITLKANSDDAFPCTANTKEVELKWMGNGFEGAANSANEVSSGNLPIIDKKDGAFYLYMENTEDTPLIFGYNKADSNSEKVICFSSMTKDIENNPHKCTYGAYYHAEDIKITYIETMGDYVVLDFSSYADYETIFYMRKGDVKFK